MHNFKALIFWCFFAMLCTYCVKTLLSFNQSISNYQKLTLKYQDLLKQQEDLNLSINNLMYKVQGVRENTLNPEVVKERLKSMMNYKDRKELIIIDN